MILDYSWDHLVLVLIVVGVYNGLVKSRMQTHEAWSQIDVTIETSE